MSHTPIRNSPQDEPRRPTPELRLPQPPVTAPAPTALLRVSELLITADSTCAKPCMPPPMSSTAVKRMLEPAPSCTRVQDGAGSNIRFTAVEDIGGGMQGFAQVESAVINNSDTRNNAVGAGAVTGGWGNRNSGVGLRGSSWGEFLIGVWDMHYNEQYAADNQLLKGPSHSSVLGLMN